MTEDIISLRAAAAELGLSPATLRTAIRRGDLRAHRLGSKLLKIRKSDLKDYVDSRLLPVDDHAPRP